MFTAPQRILLCITTASLFACAGFDGHDQTLPPEIIEAIQQLSSETAENRESQNSDPTEVSIGKILIINRTVLADDDMLAPILNNIHFVTQKDTIYDELDLKEGETVPRSRIYDAARYVRLLGPIKAARIFEQYNPVTGKTDLTVVTRDRYSPKITTGASGTGGYSAIGIRLTEPSLFGRLYTLAGSYSRENFRDFVSLNTGKARINGSRWEVGGGAMLGFADSQHNYNAYTFNVAHPFTRNGQKHGFNLSGNFTQGVNYDYLASGIRRGTDSDTGKTFDLIYRTRVENISAQYLYGIGVNDRIEFGPGLVHNIRQDYYINPADQYSLGNTPALPVSAASRTFYQPQQYSTHAVSFAVNTRNGNFVPMRNFQRYIFTEDQFEGLRTYTNIVHANPSLGLTDHYTMPSFTASYQKNSHDQKLRMESSFSRIATLWHSGPAYATDDMWSAELRGFWFTKFGTLALRGNLAQGYHLTQNMRATIATQFTRGFSFGSVYSSAGNLTSIEYRSPGLKLPYIIIAGVLFYDHAGIGETLNSLNFYSIAGFGIRSMWHEFDNNVFRIDFGFNLNDHNFNFRNALQFGLSHSF